MDIFLYGSFSWGSVIWLRWKRQQKGRGWKDRGVGGIRQDGTVYGAGGEAAGA